MKMSMLWKSFSCRNELHYMNSSLEVCDEQCTTSAELIFDSKWLLHRQRCRNSSVQSHKMPVHKSVVYSA